MLGLLYRATRTKVTTESLETCGWTGEQEPHVHHEFKEDSRRSHSIRDMLSAREWFSLPERPQDLCWLRSVNTEKCAQLKFLRLLCIFFDKHLIMFYNQEKYHCPKARRAQIEIQLHTQIMKLKDAVSLTV